MTEIFTSEKLNHQLLAGKTVFITGAGRRIGAMIAKAAAQDGADIVIHRNKSGEKANELVKEIKTLGREVSIEIADFSKPESSLKLAEKFFRNYHIDILINNAAIFEPISFQDTSLDTWQRHININLTAPFLFSQAFAKSLPETQKARIINIVDWRALRPGADHFAYTISKAGLVSLTYAMAAALAPRITVNAVAFGAVMPPSDGSKAEKFLIHVPSGRLATPEEVRQTMLFLMTGPEYITGEVIYLDGGRHLY